MRRILGERSTCPEDTVSPTPDVYADVYADLAAESEALDTLVTGLSPRQWALPTPAPGWTIAHQIAHLASTARLARAAATDPATFATMTTGAAADFDAAVARLLKPYLVGLPTALLTRWRVERALAIRALSTRPPGQPVQWVGRKLTAGMLASAGIMEVFAHGQDIIDTVGGRIEPTDRIRHLVNFAMGNRTFGYLVRGETPPDQEFRFELTAPSGQLWEYGPADAAQRISGPATDFCLLTTRRRHRDDLRLVASGPDAERWLTIAQAYRGSPGSGRRPGQFAASGPPAAVR
jgi:enediyne biosynthesis protein E11